MTKVVFNVIITFLTSFDLDETSVTFKKGK